MLWEVRFSAETERFFTFAYLYICVLCQQSIEMSLSVLLKRVQACSESYGAEIANSLVKM